MLGSDCSVEYFINEIQKNMETNKLFLTGNCIYGFFQITVDPLNYEVNKNELYICQDKFEFCSRWTDVSIKVNEEESIVYYLYFNKKNDNERNNWNWDIAIEFI